MFKNCRKLVSTSGVKISGCLLLPKTILPACSNTHYLLQYSTATGEKLETKSPNNSLFSAQYCLGLVQKHDHENYLSTLLLNKELRRHAFALRAFNVEVSKCGANVSEEHIGKMRLKFWHDSIDKCYDKQQASYVSDQPVLHELKQTLSVKKLSKMYLKRLVTARDRPANLPFQTLRQLEDYADQTSASILHLLVELCDVRDIQVDHAASHLGKAHGITLMLRSIPYTGRRQTIGVPLEILIRHGVSQERILRCSPDDKGVEECVFEVASAANQHLEMARELVAKVPKMVRKLFLPAVATERYLERLRRANFQLTHPSCTQRDLLLPIALYTHLLRGKY